jgi:hypothetical protein
VTNSLVDPGVVPKASTTTVTQLTGDHGDESFPEIRIRGKNKSGRAQSSFAASAKATAHTVRQYSWKWRTATKLKASPRT